MFPQSPVAHQLDDLAQLSTITSVPPARTGRADRLCEVGHRVILGQV
jgi:hypothetical protein